MIEGQATGGRAAKLRYGMIGGGPGAFIGDVHRKAVAMDGGAELVCGVFSQSFESTLAAGDALGLPRERLYRTFDEMVRTEAKRPDRPDFISVVTPNSSHFPAAKLALEHGFSVLCEKPLATRASDASELACLVRETGLLFGVAYAYSGYPMVKHLRDLVAGGGIGEVRFVNGEYPQEWLMSKLEDTGQKQAAWRTDPKLAGASNCVGDIGSHIEFMAAYLTGLEIESLCARLDRFGAGRPLDDNATIMVDYKGGAKGLYWSSQIAVGYDNGLRFRVFGTKGPIQWSQENPNYLTVSRLGQPTVTLSRGRDGFHPHAQSYSRIPSGHPEGYFEAFANIYPNALRTIAARVAGETPDAADLDFPTVQDGARGVHFIETALRSAREGAQGAGHWVDATYAPPA